MVEHGVLPCTLEEVLSQSDIVSMHAPARPEVEGMLGEKHFRMMKPTAIFVNVGRAAIVDERALYEHLRDQPEFCAGIDTWWHEPGAEGPGSGFSTRYPFFDLPNVIGSPHNSGVTDGALQVGAHKAAENVRRFLRGEPVIGVARREDYL